MDLRAADFEDPPLKQPIFEEDVVSPTPSLIAPPTTNATFVQIRFVKCVGFGLGVLTSYLVSVLGLFVCPSLVL